MLDFQAARWLINGEIPKQAGNNHPTSIPTGVFKTADGHINIATTGQVIWERFCRVIEAAELISHPDYATGALRSKNRDALNAEIDKRLSRRASAEWIDALNAAGVPCGPIYSIDRMFADPQVSHLDLARPVKMGDGRELRMVRQPVSLSRTPSYFAAPPPGRGEHTAEVLREFGFSAEEIDALRRARAV
jgi:formyl-CoA transferase